MAWSVGIFLFITPVHIPHSVALAQLFKIGKNKKGNKSAGNLGLGYASLSVGP